MKYNNIKKYKVIDAKINKKLINDELSLEPVRSRGPSVLQLILKRLDKMDSRFDSMDKRFDKIEAKLDEHGRAIANINARMDRNNLKP